MAVGKTVFRLGYEISPIILTGGIASAIPGGMLPIVAITEAGALLFRILSGNLDFSLDNFFAHYKPLPGGTLINNAIGQYPFANQTVAANAIIAQPTNVSMLMICPVRKSGGFTNKLITFTALKQTLDMHIAKGGTFTVMTPAQAYLNCILKSLRDVTGQDTKQAQSMWQWEFEKPLIALSDATQAYNSLLSKIDSGVPTGPAPSWSGLATTLGSTISGAASSIVDGAKNLVGTASSAISTAATNVIPGA